MNRSISNSEGTVRGGRVDTAEHDGYRAVRTAAGFLDRSARGRIGVGGADRLRFLHALLTNDIAGLVPGTGCYALYLTPQGRMIADMRVLALGDRVLLDVEARTRQPLLQILEHLIFSEDVMLEDVTDGLAQIGVHGPASDRVVAQALDASEMAHCSPDDIALWHEGQNSRWLVGGDEIVLARRDDFGEQGFEVYLPRGRAETLGHALRTGGAEPVSEEVADVLRVEAGRPLWGVDMDEETIPLEAGIEARAISMTKGCYVGQEVIVRILHRGHGRVARKLVGLAIQSASGVAHGDVLYVGDQSVGRITSAVVSPAFATPIALGYLHRDFLAPGTRVDVQHESARFPAIVTPLPFVQTRGHSGAAPGGASPSSPASP